MEQSGHQRSKTVAGNRIMHTFIKGVLSIRTHLCSAYVVDTSVMQFIHKIRERQNRARRM